MLRDMELTIGKVKKTRSEVDALQSTHTRINEQIKSIKGKIRAVEQRKSKQARY